MMAASLHLAFDGMVARFAGEDAASQVARAHEEYESRTGRVFAEDDLYDARAASFLEWYLIERPFVESGDRAPVALALESAGAGEQARALFAWATSHTSLFQLVRVSSGRVLLDDLLGGGRFVVDERRQLPGVYAGDIVEARLLGWQGSVLFGNTFLYHPAKARAAILAHAERIKRQGGSRKNVIDHIAALRIRAERYRHLPSEHVYALYTGEASEDQLR